MTQRNVVGRWVGGTTVEGLEQRTLLAAAPLLDWSSYLGGDAGDYGSGIAIDSSGNAWVTGTTQSTNLGNGGFDSGYNGGGDAFVAKINADGTLAWVSYLGGSGYDNATTIAIDPWGNAWVAGSTSSSNLPRMRFGSTYKGGASDIFVAVFDVNGNLAWTDYLGGSGTDRANAIAVDSRGNGWVTGSTTSTNFASGGFDTSYGGSEDAFVATMNGSGVGWSSYLGGSGSDAGYGIALDGSGNAWVTGGTSPSGWASGGFDTTSNGGRDTFVAKINAVGTLAWSSYLGGSGDDSGSAIAVDGKGNAWVTGYTSLGGWAGGGLDASYQGGSSDAFVAKINAKGTLAWSGYLGGSDYEYSVGIAIDGGGKAWVTGRTASADLAGRSVDTSHRGGEDAYVAMIDANGALAWSRYIGGSSGDQGESIALDRSGAAWIVGQTQSLGWTSSGFDTSHNGGDTDAFVAKVSNRGAGSFGMVAGKVVPLTIPDGLDSVTFKLSGGGTGAVTAAGLVTLTGTTAKSALSITVKKANGGDGLVYLSGVSSDGLLKSISASAAVISGQVQINTLNRVAGKTTLSLKLGQIDDADITVRGLPVSSVTVGGAVSGSRIVSTASIGKFTAGALLDSDILVGVAADFAGQFAGSAGDFADAAAKLGSLTVKGRKVAKGSSHPAYVSGVYLSAPSIGTLKLANVSGVAGSIQAKVRNDTGTLTITALSPVLGGVSVLTAGSWRPGAAGRPAVFAVV